jgi:hypothetical protein
MLTATTDNDEAGAARTHDVVAGLRWAERSPVRPPADSEEGARLSELIGRARGEFTEMPGMRLTSRQAARLWGLDAGTSERLLGALVRAGFLMKRGENYSRVGGP